MEQNPYVAIEHGGPGTIGWRVHYYDGVTSTQDVARHFALDGAEHGMVVIAESQTHGHGRIPDHMKLRPVNSVVPEPIKKSTIALRMIPTTTASLPAKKKNGSTGNTAPEANNKNDEPAAIQGKPPSGPGFTGDSPMAFRLRLESAAEIKRSASTAASSSVRPFAR